MTESLRPLLDRWLDYAGLFPPAGLKMFPAVRTYRRHREGPHAWMLARFICPVARLEELVEARREAGAADEPWILSTLAPSEPGAESFARGLATPIHRARRFAVSQVPLTPDTLETALPPALAPGETEAVVSATADAVLAEETPYDHLFLEIPRGEAWRDRVRAVAGAASRWNARGSGQVGLKIRMGGDTPDAVPSPADTAAFLAEAHAAGVPLKATAGLHHPVRHHAAGGRHAPMHGFLNLFFAAALLREGATPDELVRVLCDEDPHAFDLGPQPAWRDRPLTPAALADTRRGFMLSVGSCSFDEPVEDLIALGWLTSQPSETR